MRIADEAIEEGISNLTELTKWCVRKGYAYPRMTYSGDDFVYWEFHDKSKVRFSGTQEPYQLMIVEADPTGRIPEGTIDV